MTIFSVMNACAVLALVAAPTFVPPAQSPKLERAQSAGELALTVDPSRSSVHWSLESSLHTVHGTFHVKRGRVTIDPATGKASGEIVVDATSVESGNDSRDKKMHQEVLESQRFNEIIFRPDRVDGVIAKQGNSAVTVHGMFLLHGAEHEFSAAAKAELSAENFKSSAAIRVPYIEWKLKNPSNFLLKVKPIVEVEIELAGPISDAH
jgi:polyisoprenoid-binding protein YceI